MSYLLDTDAIRSEFAILTTKVNKQPLVYLDNAATSQTPSTVLETSRLYYETQNSNIHRGVHYLSRIATEAHEAARTTIAQYLNAPKEQEVIFTSGTTDSINLVADILYRGKRIQQGDRILVSELEHHSNIVPWQMLCEQTGATLDVIPITDSGEFDLTNIDDLIVPQTKLVAISHVSNALGTINPIELIISKAKKVKALTLIDGAQSAPHMPIDLQQLDCDFYTFSGHKTYAPTGIGILWGREDVLNDLPPWKGGGEMIKEVSFSGTTYNDLPFKYEAGTPNIEGAIALAKALEWMQELGVENIAKHEQTLLQMATKALNEIDGINIYGTGQHKAGVVSFLLEGVHHFDLGTIIDQMGIAVRTGHHCCQPLMARFGITGTARASFAAYNTPEEIERFITAVKKAKTMLS